jgi:lipid-binding SYLF domain-containing protein
MRGINPILGGAIAAAVFTLTGAMSGCGAPGGTVEEKREAILTMADETLKKLYSQDASAKKRVDDAVGYAVFSNVGVNVLLLATGNGYGVVTDNRTGKKTYMRMGEAGVGIGLGVKDFRAVFAFYNEDTLDQFMDSGWDFGGDADAAAKAGDKGAAAEGQANVQSGMEIWTMTEAGLALQATVQGTKYWPYAELN